MSNNKIYKNLGFILPIIALITALLCSVAFAYSFNSENGYFTNSPLSYIFYVALAASIAFAIISTALDKSDRAYAARSNRTSSLILMLACLLYLISFIATPVPAHMTRTFLVLTILSLVVAIAHLLLLGIGAKLSDSATVATGLGVVFAPIILATASYFDHSQELNSPYKLIFEFACLAFALYYVTDLRSNTDTPRKKMLTGVAAISTTLTLCAGVAKIFEIIYNSSATPINIASAILFAAMASCTASKLLQQ